MKKITLLAAVAVLATTFASCRKDRTCECVATGTSVVTDTYVIHSTKSTATTLCSAYQSYGETCALK